MRPIVVIPSRLASTRLPRKALADIAGIPMIAHVARRAVASALGPVIVAAGDPEILEAVRGIDGVRGVLTDPALPSGSDRVQAALERVDPKGEHDVAINLQGDLPLIDPISLRRVLDPLAQSENEVGTLVAPIRDPVELAADSVVKVACAFREGESTARALYFSRCPLPWGEGAFWHHIGVYAWRREALSHFVALAPSPLEVRERLEQLRALEAGMRIGCAPLSHAPLGVDTADDLKRVRTLI